MDNKQLNEIFRSARELSDPAKWTTGCYARNKDGKKVDPVDPTAVTFCVLGACRHVGKVDSDRYFTNDLLNAIPDCGTIYVFNDTHTHREVLNLLDKAISLTNS